jgi:flavocytochrome c
MRKLFVLLLCLTLLVTALPALAYTAGTYTASAQGNNGPVEVSVTFDGDRITDITVTNHSETAGIAEAPIEKIPTAIVAGQTLKVDVISGATMTSNAILAAVADCVQQAGGDVEALKVAEATTAVAEDEEITYDVVVLGGGAAGLAAAAEAADAGASVVLLEKLSHLGGNTLISGGLVYATGTSFQKDAGVEDSVESLVDYWMTRAEGNADEAMLTLVAEKSGETIDWLMKNGVELTGPTTSGTSPVPRMQSAGGGSGIVLPLTEAVEARGVKIYTDTAAQTLLTDETGAVIGVEALAADGHKVTAYANRGVVIATGGYDVSEEMKAKYAPSIAGSYSYSSPGNVGDGINMATAVGADTVFKDGSIGFRGIRESFSFASALDAQIWNPYLYVDATGARFVNESSDYPIFHSAMLKNGSDHFFLIYDAATANAEVLDPAVEEGYAYKADTIEALAEAAGMDAATFTATVSRYNELAGKEDADFGKSAELMTGIGEGPYYALKVVPATIGSMGGVKTDLSAQVLNTEGAVIPGLYAAGAVANGDFFYKEYPASGTSIQMCLTMGRIAGANAAARVK